jgi:hypothetical protein
MKESKEEWTVTGRVFVFGRFQKIVSEIQARRAD